ncbi:MAG: peroxidase family protein, partial [Pseudomonadota bacterium]
PVKQRHPGISHSDMWVLAAYAALEKTGGPVLKFKGGRKDATDSRFPGEESSVHLMDFPETPVAWRDEALAAKWAKIRSARRVVLGALEIERREKTIGASLEAAPILFVDDAEVAALVRSVDMAELCITSALELREGPAPAEAFRLEEPTIGVLFAKAQGQKCARCWKILPDVGTHKHEMVCARCDAVLG